jgi:hypothetical protein
MSSKFKPHQSRRPKKQKLRNEDGERYRYPQSNKKYNSNLSWNKNQNNDNN